MDDNQNQPPEDQIPNLYHGTPHRFDKFDIGKLGTGEGAQVYGHGLYFAEQEPVAKEYRDALSSHLPSPIMVNGEPIYNYSPMLRMVAQRYGDIDDAAKAMSNKWNKAKTNYESTQSDPDSLEHFVYSLEYDEAQKQQKELESLRGKKVKYGPKGSMYEVKIDSHPDHLLDWNKPISQQSPYVRKALTRLANTDDDIKKRFMEVGGDDAPGEYIYHHLNEYFSRNKKYENMRNGIPEENALPSMKYGPQAASEALLAHGIHGIRYFDAGSRGATAIPTNNYVIFDDKLINVKRRYKHGGTVPPLNMSGKGPINKAMELTRKKRVGSTAMNLAQMLQKR